MNHPTTDELLLLAYGDLPEADARLAEAHIATCATCREALARLDQPRALLETAIPRRGRISLWVPAALAAAALLAAVLVTRTSTSRPDEAAWQPVSIWSANAGYVAGGRAVVEIDAQLTRLERERPYGLRK